MPAIVWILCGGVLPLASAYGLGRFLLRKSTLPGSIALAAGAALISHVIFFVMLAGLAGVGTFVAIAGLTIPLGVWAWWTHRSICQPRARGGISIDTLILAGILLVYGILYAVHALAPEIRSDGYTYHLGLPAEWLRLGGFSNRIGFYEMVPQGLEMLFAFAFAFGNHSAAKLVHFAFLVLTVPLIVSIGRKLDIPDVASCAAAVLYVCSPVVGTSSTAAYSDAALVFYCLATFYLVLVWSQEEEGLYLVLAGLTAGFCYSIKFTGLIAAPVVVALALFRRRWILALGTGLAAALMIAPWMTRNLLWADNPLAPLFNSQFPNPYFHVSMEQHLARALRSYDGVTLASFPLEITMKGQRLQGLIGPLFLLAPLGLLALRRKAGRNLIAAAALMAVPYYFNIGARFAMPALVFVALALAIALPLRAILACAIAQAVLCFPAVVPFYAAPGAWTLHGFPWQAALRIEREENYLRRELWEYRLASLLRKHVHPGERVLDLVGAPTAYTDAVALSPWQSASGDRMVYALQLGVLLLPGVLAEFDGRWHQQPLTSLRVLQTATFDEQWGINEIELFRGAERVPLRGLWKPVGNPNTWEARFAFDDNLISRWGTWMPAQPHMYVGVDFGEPVQLSSARVVCLTHEQRAALVLEGRTPSGEWRRLSGPAKPQPLPLLNVRRSVHRLLRQEGVRFILASLGEAGYGSIGRALAERPSDWGVRIVARNDNIRLFELE